MNSFGVILDLLIKNVIFRESMIAFCYIQRRVIIFLMRIMFEFHLLNQISLVEKLLLQVKKMNCSWKS